MRECDAKTFQKRTTFLISFVITYRGAFFDFHGMGDCQVGEDEMGGILRKGVGRRLSRDTRVWGRDRG